VSGPTETGPSQPIIKTMSCFGSGEKNEKPKELVARDNRIQEQLEKHGSELKLTAKILLLGTGESGKSTVYKQLNIIHKNAYPPEECIKFKDIIVTNVLDSIRALIEACDNLGVEFGSPEMKVCVTLHPMIVLPVPSFLYCVLIIFSCNIFTHIHTRTHIYIYKYI
jgi:energy-coupling factor transporter ATP-binding protein EcfA2